MKKINYFSRLAGLFALLFSMGMQAQLLHSIQLSDTTYSNKEALFCTLSDGSKLFFSNELDTSYSASGYFFLTLYRIESESQTLNIPGDYVYRGHHTSIKRVLIHKDSEYQCDLQQLTIPDGTEALCLPSTPSLTTLNLPSTMVCFNFTLSENFKDLYLHSVFPPYWGEMYGSYGLYRPMTDPITDVTVHVPTMAMSLYSQSNPYKDSKLVALEEPVQHLFVGYQPDITIQNTDGLSENAVLTLPRWYAITDYELFGYYSTSILAHNDETAYEEKSSVLRYGEEAYFYPAQLTIDADQPVKLQKFKLEQDCGEYYYGNNRYKIMPSTAIFRSPVTAEEIEMTYHMFRTNVRWKGKYNDYYTAERGINRFYFVSFPFDVKISDIAFPDWQDKSHMEVICMEYDGAKRATVASSTYWRQLSGDEVLHANKGYLIEFYGKYTDSDHNTRYNTQTTLHLKAMDTENKQQIFSNNDVTVPLTAHPSQYKHREGWNVIGNPYPCIFDIHYLDFTAPITVFDGFSYYPFSPLDDDYYLYPNEAFFVQCPEGTSSVTFRKDGRLHNDPNGLWQLNVAGLPGRFMRRAADSDSERRVYNFILNGETGFDRTRIVLNELASKDYELAHDAAKMMGQGGSPQLYVLDNGIQYAIDERPLEDGIFSLGMIFPETGSYTLSLKDNPDEQMAVILTDHLKGAELDITETAYTFDATVGSTANRFSIRFAKKGTEAIQHTNAASGEPVYYDLQGRILQSAPAQSGVYILRQGQTTQKIIVK